ncbi:NADH:flavin oxidoreductase/NADH oxidase [Deinococcus radiophilus]|uniref:NADH:flavin oxidoreductase/NADH oxidase n=1 Tax=Deinococcus radiophilus TaxID=32062 RepID=A0A3S0JWY8_9DEIO|nr:NADH:flavin oxidoreductase/NADH oxidase [Deinococcus radiophilus]RTR30695.1 NADH:flavin oxidoreductase/NADH oxidase [Deinococcus radiophilus]
MTIPTHPTHRSDDPIVTPQLLQGARMKGLELRNRIAVSPMCMYSAKDGLANDFHMVHYGQFALGGAGLILMEATAVSPEGRISAHDLGLWSDDQIGPLGHITDFAHAHGSKIGVQLAHAGRKASTHRPGDGHGAISLERGGWEVIAASEGAYSENYPRARAMTTEEVAAAPAVFAAAARRAEVAGFDTVEIHAAHGYLLHQFLSPLSNDRTDEYGGSFENRTRLLVDTVRAVREVWPEHLPLLVRISATDWVEGGWDLEQSVALAKVLRYEGADVLDVSSGGLDPRQQIPVEPLYQAPLAHRIKQEAPELGVMAVGLIETPMQAEQLLQEGMADWVALGRAMLRDPHWPQRAAREFGIAPELPQQYGRAGW